MKYYILTDHEDNIHLTFFRKKFKNLIIHSAIAPTCFPNKKKAKRVLKKLNKTYPGDYFLVNEKQLGRRF